MMLSPDAGTDVTDSGNDEPTVTEGETTDDTTGRLGITGGKPPNVSPEPEDAPDSPADEDAELKKGLKRKRGMLKKNYNRGYDPNRPMLWSAVTK